MRKTSLNLLILSASLLMGCEEYNMGLSIEDITYRHAFNEAFGDIDPLHTWNTAAQRSLDFHINVPGTFYLRVFTTEPRVASAESELLAYYKNDGKGYKGCTGESYSINFDCPSGLKKVFADIEYVDDGRHIMLPVNFDENGHGVVEFGKMVATRGTIHVGTDTSNKIYRDDEDIMHFTKEAYDGSLGGFLDLIPENVENTNKEHVSVDFSYVSTGQPLHLYPMYVYTGADVTIGLQYKASHSASWPDYDEETQKIWTTTRTRDLVNNTGGRIQRYFTGGATDWGASPYGQTDYTPSNFEYAICPGITINLPAGYEFRFWVLQKYGAGNSQSFIRYSTSDVNSNPDKLHYFGTFNNGHKHPDEHGNLSDVLYLGVEDWNNSRHDINDVVMAFVGELPLVLEDITMIYDEAEYTIAYEDMGAIGDFDFNDVVFSVRHVSGATKAEVDLRAVGGTLPVKLKHNESYLFGGKELHTALGEVQPTPITSMTPINVSGSGNTVNRTNMYFVEDESITIPTDGSILTEAGNFSLEVVREDGTKSEIRAADPNKTGDEAKIPQAIIVAKHNWDWPTENTRISTAYPKFSEWVSKREKVHWYTPIWSGEDEHSTNIDYGVTLMPSYAYEKCLLNRDDIDLKEEEVGLGNAYELVIPKSDLVITHYNENGSAEVNHNLWEYDSFNLAFVVTGRTSGQTVTLKVYKNSVGGELIETITFDDTHHNSTTSSSSFGESLSQEVNINWADVEQIVIKVEEHPTNCHLNSIWTAMPEKDFHIMPRASITETIKNEGDQASIALAFVASAQHVVDFTNGSNGWRSFSNYAVMLSQIETNGKTTNSPILYTLKRKKEAGHYMLLNPRGGYLKAPSSNNTAHEWTTDATQAADLVIEACPNITLMQGCSHENAVSIKTTVSETTYYFSANKPAMWRTSPTDHQKAIYLFHWGSHN